MEKNIEQQKINIPESIYEPLADAAKAYSLVVKQAMALQKTVEQLKEENEALKKELDAKREES